MPGNLTTQQIVIIYRADAEKAKLHKKQNAINTTI